MANVTAGLVFRADAIEAVVLKRGFWGRLKLDRCARAPITAETPDHAAFHDQEVAQALQEVLSVCQVSTKQVAVTVPAKDVLLRCFKLPMLPKPEWEEAVQFEVRKYIPFKMDELTWTYHVVEHRAEKRLTAVFIGIRTDALLKIYHHLEAAGIEATGMEAWSVSLSRAAALGTKPRSKEGFVVVVDLEQDVAHIAVMKEGLPYLSRDVSLNAAGRGEVAGQAERPGQVDRRAELLLSELRLSLEYFIHEHAYAAVEKILLFGEEYVAAPWCPWLSEQLHYPVELGTLTIPAAPGSPAAPLQFATAIGLAIKGVHGIERRLDFLLHGKSSAQRQKLTTPTDTAMAFLRRMARPAVIQTAVAAVGLLLLAGLEHRAVATAQAQLHHAILRHQQLGGGIEQKSSDELQKLSQQLKARLAFLRSGILQRVSVAEKLDALAKTLPDGVWLETISYTNRLQSLESWQPSLTLRGACLLPDAERELDVISIFAKRIKQDPGFSRGFASAQLGEIVANEDAARQYSYRTFRLDCQTQSKVF